MSWTFDKLGRVSKVRNPLAYSTNPTTDFNYTYLGNSALVDKISALSGTSNGIVRDFDWYTTAQGRFLKQIKHTKTPSGSNISVFDYTYGTGTEFGQIKTLARTLPSSGGTTWTTTTQTFTHDVIGQLKQSAETGLPTRTYTYDVAGNRATKSEGGVSTTYGVANTVNQIISATGGTDAYSSATSDVNGNLTQIVYSDGSRRVMTWDSINRLKRIEIRAGVNPAYLDKATDFTYNGLSQRTQNTNWTHDGTYWASVTYDWFVWGDGEIVQKRAGSTSFTNGTNYYAEGESRHTVTSSTKHYYTRDHLGTVYEMTDWAGAAQAAYTYGPYGDRSKRYGSYEAEISYTDHWVYKPSAATHAAAKQLYLTWYRVYDPQAGRWLSRDPIGEAGGLNLYGYEGNGPTMAWDPLGLDARFVIQRDAGRNSPGTMHAFENGAYLGSTRVNENRYIGKSNGIPCGRYLLLPRTDAVQGKSIYPNGTPSVTHPNYRRSPGRAGPGYRATVFVHGPSSDGTPDSKACITTDMHQEVRDVMDRNMSNGGTTMHNNIRRTTFRGQPVEWERPVRR